MQNNKLLIIVGPTASGKSSLAISAAKSLNSPIISADSMQIYKNMNVGTAKETGEILKIVPHYMLDIVEPTMEFSVAEFQAECDKHIQNAFNQHITPIICGGTGLYIEAVMYPLNFSNTSKDTKLRDQLNAEYDDLGGDAMLKRLSNIDAEAAAKLHPNDKKRIVRALEICACYGKKTNSELKTPRYDYVLVGLDTDRDKLYSRINERVDFMFENGLENEVKSLLNSGVTFENQSMQAIGYKEFLPYLKGEINLEKLKDTIKQNTRNYAKRQLTWLKRYKDINWFDALNPSLALDFIKDNFKGNLL